MAKARQGGKTATNRHGTVRIPVIDRALLGTKEFPLAVYKGEKDEAGVWIARIKDLPGYLGWGQTEAEAIKCLWQEIGDGPIYDVRGMHRLAPTAANIRYVLGHAKRVEAARVTAEGTTNSEALAATAKVQRVTRNALDLAIATGAMWQRFGGIDAYVASLGQGHVENARDFGLDPESFFERNPERAIYFLARSKFPKTKKSLANRGIQKT